MDPADIFAELFGGGGGGGGFHFGFDVGGGMGGGMHRTRGEDSVITYDVSLEDLYNGKCVSIILENPSSASESVMCTFVRRSLPERSKAA